VSESVLADAFGHHAWANRRLIDVCATLTPEQLASSVPGTYGTILDTMRHLIASDAGYLSLLTGGSVAEIDEESLDIDGVRAAMAGYGAAWNGLVGPGLDPDEDVVRHRDDGTRSHASRGLRLVQALHHGTDHRSQVCTALTVLGVEPPAIDVWDFAREQGRIIVEPAPEPA
jgi:uncharacterized damage-inducible protein DinB